MIWATVSSWSCFCCLYGASLSLVAEIIINLTQYWPSDDVHVQSCLLYFWKRVFAMTSAFSWQNSVSLCHTAFCIPSPKLPITPGIYEPCCVGPPKMDGSWWSGLTKHGPLEKGMANHFSILALRTPWTVWKGKKIGHWKMNSPGWQVPNMLLENSGEITPERMKGWSQSKNNNPVVDVTGDRSKVRCCKEQYCIGTWNVRSMN